MTQKHEEALTRLQEGIESITSEEGFQQWLRTLSQFHAYSWGNVTMIYRQKPDATQVAGFHTWNKKFNRKVKKGAKSISIFAPMVRKLENDEGETFTQVRGFKAVPVFDVSDTEGDPLPEGPAEIVLKGSSEVGENLLPILQGVLLRNDLRYERQDIAPTRGAFNPLKKLVTTDEALELDMEVKVLTHELVHYLAGHGERMAEYQMNREEIETVTESTAFVVLDHFGMDTSDASFSYIAHWSQDVDTVKRNLEMIQKLSTHVIEQIESEIRARYIVPEGVAA